MKVKHILKGNNKKEQSKSSYITYKFIWSVAGSRRRRAGGERRCEMRWRLRERVPSRTCYSVQRRKATDSPSCPVYETRHESTRKIQFPNDDMAWSDTTSDFISWYLPFINEYKQIYTIMCMVCSLFDMYLELYLYFLVFE